MKESKVEEFLRKVDRPWGMSKQELEQFQSEVKQLKSEQNKVAVDKLEEVLKKVKQVVIYKEDTYSTITLWGLNNIIQKQIKELKGESDD